MFTFVVVLILVVAAAVRAGALVAADGRGQRPGPRSHRREVELDQHARLLELNA